MRGYGVAGDELPVSPSTRLRLVFLPVQRVLTSDIRGRGGGQLKPLQPFLSPARQNAEESLGFHDFSLWSLYF